MKPGNKLKIIQSSAGIAIAICLLFSSGARLPFIDTRTDAYFQEAIKKAGISYAACRVINASVSIIKDSSLQLEPAGVGISLAVGQALDPIDDMTERLSDVLVTAITSLGIQKLAYEIGVSLTPPVLSIFVFVLSVMVWFKNEKLRFFNRTLIRFTLLIIVARLCLPVSSVANEFIHKNFFADQISNARKELAKGSADLDELKNFSLPEADGVIGTIENSASFIKRKSIEFKNALMDNVSRMGNIIENLLKLTFLYAGIFLIQVIILPIAVFWLLVKISNAPFPADMPVILHHSKSAGNDRIQETSSSGR